MPKLPKKTTMIATIERVENYAYKMLQMDKFSMKDWTHLKAGTSKLKKAIKK